MADVDRLYVIATDLLQCAQTRIIQEGLVAPGRVFVAPGDVAVNVEVCCEVQLSVRLVDAFLSSTFPVEREFTVPGCDESILVGVFAVQVDICTPVIADDGSLPSAEALDVSALEILAYGLALFRGVRCCVDALRAQEEEVDALIGHLAPVAPTPLGGCVSYEVRVTVAIPEEECGCPDA